MDILVTGATGNIGVALIGELLRRAGGNAVYAGVRSVEKAKRAFPGLEALNYREFDFEDPGTFAGALEGIDLVFLLRPPHISKIGKVFRPLFDAIKAGGVGKVVILSVQGAETSDIIPHRKIEKLALEYGLDWIFARPSYFMQNLTTTLLDDIRKRRTIALPAKDAKFNWIDIGDIAAACAALILEFDERKNQAYVLTGRENLGFAQVVGRINELTGAGIAYLPIGPVRFVFRKLREGMKPGMAFVMCLLHFLPRLQAEPEITDTCRALTGKEPSTIDDFIRRDGAAFRAPLSKPRLEGEARG